MKPFLLLPAIAVLLAAGTASAQKEAMLQAAFHPAGDAAIHAILTAQHRSSAPVAAKAAQSKMRIAGYGYRTTLGSYRDSIRLYYAAGNRFGSDSLRYRVWNEVDNVLDGNITYGRPDAAPDSLVRWGTSSGAFARQYSVGYAYDAAGNALSYEKTVVSPAYGNSCVRYLNAYRADGTRSGSEGWQPSGGTLSCGAYVPANWLRYDAAGNALSDSSAYGVMRNYYTGARLDSAIYTYPAVAATGGVKRQRQIMYYNGAGLLSGSRTVRTDSFFQDVDTEATRYYRYDALQRLDSTYTRYGGLMIGNGAASQAFSYTGAFPRPTDVRSYGHGYAGTPLPPAPAMYISSRWGYHLNAAGLWDTVYFYSIQNNAAALTEKDPVVLNAAGFIDYVSGYAYDAATGVYSATPYDRNQYYYESFDDGNATTSVHQPAPITPMQATVYPNPAGEQLQLSVTLTEARPLRYAVYDAAGRPCGDGGDAAAAAKHSLGVPLQSLPSGAYYLQISAGDERCVKPFSVLH